MTNLGVSRDLEYMIESGRSAHAIGVMVIVHREQIIKALRTAPDAPLPGLVRPQDNVEAK